MSKRSQRDDGEVKVHFTYFGGMYVDPNELLRSKAARETMAKMARALGDEDSVRRVEEGAAHGRQEPPNER